MILSKDLETLISWLKIRELGMGSFPASTDGLVLAMYKSALLQRMMEGKDPLPEPPPKTFSYPWYSLIENGVGYPTDVWEAEGLEEEMFGKIISVNQFQWKIIEKVGPENWIVTYYHSFDHEKQRADGYWQVYRQENKEWIIKKINYKAVSVISEL